MRAMALIGACALLVVSAVPAFAAQKTGCSNGQGWAIVTVEDASETIWPELLDTSPFPGGIADLEAALAGYDRNGDGWLCVKTQGGEDTNPNAHWYRVGVEILGSPTMFFIPSDNNRGATD